MALFGRLAEIAGQYLKKGSSVYVEGRIRTNKWQDQQGQDRYTTEIVANEMQFLGGNNGQGVARDAAQSADFDQASDFNQDTTVEAPAKPQAAMKKPQAPAPGLQEFDSKFEEDEIPF